MVNISLIGYTITEKNGYIETIEQMETLFPIKNDEKLHIAFEAADLIDNNNGQTRNYDTEVWHWEYINPSYVIGFLFFDEDTHEEVIKDSIEYVKQTIIKNV
jgi:hypothetical protein